MELLSTLAVKWCTSKCSCQCYQHTDSVLSPPLDIVYSVVFLLLDSGGELSECEEVDPGQVRIHDSTAKTPQIQRLGDAADGTRRRRSSGMIKTFEKGRACSTYGESRNAYSVSWEAGGTSPLENPRRRWEDNIKMDLREMGYDHRDWINLAQDRDRWRAYVRAAMNLRVP
ncbi:hypothetical protein ANN_20859 [Periplaneta americana]|uniref:Uncharacterized protein n=1 Tax=Periplaneta americana TaxID=6978 RepID=A0ABQ8SE28_PERAM|nr:hypothetical protein ANN_20859 [Periplaneta americana]